MLFYIYLLLYVSDEGGKNSDPGVHPFVHH